MNSDLSAGNAGSIWEAALFLAIVFNDGFRPNQQKSGRHSIADARLSYRESQAKSHTANTLFVRVVLVRK